MRYQEKIYEGMPIELVVFDGEYQGIFKTRIEEIKEKSISIGVPIIEGQFIPLRENTKLEVFFFDVFTAYKFATAIIERIILPIPIFIIEYPAEIIKIQRRQFVRVQAVIPLVYRLLNQEGSGEYKKAYMINFSGGGALLKSLENIPTGTLILVKAVFGTTEMEVPACVTRSIPKDDQGFFRFSIQFQQITEKQRDRIIKYVFDIQREMRKKGLV